MDAAATQAYTAFVGTQRLATGPVHDVARAVKIHVDAYPEPQMLMFDSIIAQSVELNLYGTVEDVLTRLDHATPFAT